MRSNRSQKNSLYEEKIERAENYGEYVGSYEIQGRTIIHYPKVCSFIDFLQTPQIRNFQLQDNFMILDYTSFPKEYEKKTRSQLI